MIRGKVTTMKVRLRLSNILKCKHNKGFWYLFTGCKPCPYVQCDCDGECSVPVYRISCKKCEQSWTVGEDEVIDFFAQKRWALVRLSEE